MRQGVLMVIWGEKRCASFSERVAVGNSIQCEATACCGERTRLACWLPRPAATHFRRCAASVTRAVSAARTSVEVRGGGDASASTRDACAPRRRAVLRVGAPRFTRAQHAIRLPQPFPFPDEQFARVKRGAPTRSEEQTSELQSHSDLVYRLLLQK